MSSDDAFSTALRTAMLRPTYRVTPGLLAKMAGVPKATIVNWLEGRVRRPRSPAIVHAICEALRLSGEEARALSAAAGMPYQPPSTMRLDRLPVGLYATTLDGRVLFANATLVRMLGYPSLEAYQRVPVRDLYADPTQRDRWIQRIDRAGTLHRDAVCGRRADRTTVELLDTATAVRDEQGAIVYFEGVWELANGRLPE